jgi:hypothetical protein
MVDNSANINKQKESFSSDGRQFYQYHKTKRIFWQWWSTILPISTKQNQDLTVMLKLSFDLLILEEWLTITVKTLFCFDDIGWIVDHHCSNFLLVCWYWRNLWLSMLNLSFVLFILVELLTITVKTFFCVMVNNSTNINKPKESFNSDSQ